MKQVNQMSKLFARSLGRRMKIPMMLIMSLLVLPGYLESKEVLTPPELKTDNNITGQVKDVNGEPLLGVNVMVKGTSVGTVTDLNGIYSLTNVTSKDVLVFSFLGMLSQEVTVGNRSQIDIVMAEDVIGLEDVVVTIHP